MKKCLFVLSLIFLAALAGCRFGSKPEDTVVKFLDAAKKFDVGAMRACVKGNNLESESENAFTEPSMNAFFKNTLSKMTYEIISSKKDGDTATVTAKIKYFDGTGILQEAMGEYLGEAMSSALSGKELTKQENSEMLGKLLEEKSTSAADVFSEVTVDINCVKENDDWMIQDLPDEMINVITSNFGKVTENLQDSIAPETDKKETAPASE